MFQRKKNVLSFNRREEGRKNITPFFIEFKRRVIENKRVTYHSYTLIDIIRWKKRRGAQKIKIAKIIYITQYA